MLQRVINKMMTKRTGAAGNQNYFPVLHDYILQFLLCSLTVSVLLFLFGWHIKKMPNKAGITDRRQIFAIDSAYDPCNYHQIHFSSGHNRGQRLLVILCPAAIINPLSFSLLYHFEKRIRSLRLPNLFKQFLRLRLSSVCSNKNSL